jgi:hypothetical protein
MIGINNRGNRLNYSFVNMQTSLWLLFTLLVFVACDTLTQLSTIAVQHDSNTIFVDESVWYRSTNNTLVNQKYELAIPAEQQSQQISMVNATSRVVLFAYNSTSVPFYWTDGKKEMERFNQLNMYKDYTTTDVKYLDTRGRDYVVVTIFNSGTNEYKLVAICLQDKTMVELLTNVQQPSVKIYQPGGVFYYIFNDNSTSVKGYLYKYNPHENNTTKVQQWNYSSNAMFLVNDGIFYHSKATDLSRYSITDDRVSMVTLYQTVVAIQAAPMPDNPSYYLVSTNGQNTYLCYKELYRCEMYNFEAHSLGSIPILEYILYVPKDSNALMYVRTYSNIRNKLIDLKMSVDDDDHFLRWDRVQYHEPTGKVLVVGSEYAKRQGAYVPITINLFGYDITTNTLYQVTNLVKDQFTTFVTPPFYFKEDGTILLIKSVNGSDHLFSLQLSGAPYQPTRQPIHFDPDEPRVQKYDTPIIITVVVVSVVIVVAVILLISIATIIKCKKRKSESQYQAAAF